MFPASLLSFVLMRFFWTYVSLLQLYKIPIIRKSYAKTNFQIIIGKYESCLLALLSTSSPWVPQQTAYDVAAGTTTGGGASVAGRSPAESVLLSYCTGDCERGWK